MGVLYFKKDDINRRILQQARKEKEIVYGAQSVRKQLGFRARPTNDYDLYARRPKVEAKRIERKLDKEVHGNKFYTKAGGHKGTYRVKYVGEDGKPMTNDDQNIADYTKVPKPAPRYKVINGVRYRTLKEELRAKERIVKNPAYAYRHEKDKKDLAILKRNIGMKRLPAFKKVKSY